jgi:hypothetical protein
MLTPLHLLVHIPSAPPLSLTPTLGISSHPIPIRCKTPATPFWWAIGRDSAGGSRRSLDSGRAVRKFNVLRQDALAASARASGCDRRRRVLVCLACLQYSRGRCGSQHPFAREGAGYVSSVANPQWWRALLLRASRNGHLQVCDRIGRTRVDGAELLVGAPAAVALGADVHLPGDETRAAEAAFSRTAL